MTHSLHDQEWNIELLVTQKNDNVPALGTTSNPNVSLFGLMLTNDIGNICFIFQKYQFIMI